VVKPRACSLASGTRPEEVDVSEDGSTRPAADRTNARPHRPPRPENHAGVPADPRELLKLGIRSPRRRSDHHAPHGMNLLPAGPAQPGPSSCGLRRGILATDFFTVETIGLKRSTSCSSSSSRRGGFAPLASRPILTRRGSPAGAEPRHRGALSGFVLVCDRDAKFSGPFDVVLRAEGVRVIRPRSGPPGERLPERFVRTVRRECLDHLLIYGRRPPRASAPGYVAH